MARRGRGRGRGRGRPRKKVVIESDDDDEQLIETSETIDNLVDIPDEPMEIVVTQDENIDSYSEVELKNQKPKPLKESEKDEGVVIIKAELNYNIDDISQLVAPTFSTLSSGPPQPMLDLGWDHPFIGHGERIPSPNVHLCELCKSPVRIYGRMIPCKHIFCHSCAINNRDKCPRCNDKVHRVETSQLGSVFMCSYEGSRYGYDGCRRTYLSQRDLQAHINHRHKPRNAPSTLTNISSSKVSPADTLPLRSSGLSRQSFTNTNIHSSRSNLISVPIQTNSRVAADTSAKYGASPETPSSTSSRYERRGSRPSQPQQHESNLLRSKWAFR